MIKKTAREMSGLSPGQKKDDQETWYWNEEVQESIQSKKWDNERMESTEIYHMAKRKVKQNVYCKLYERLDTKEGKMDL